MRNDTFELLESEVVAGATVRDVLEDLHSKIHESLVGYANIKDDASELVLYFALKKLLNKD